MGLIIGNGIGIPFNKQLRSYWATRTPTNLVVPSQTATTIKFSWTAGAEEPEGYKLKISTDGVNYTDKTTVNGSTTTAQATGLTAGTLYYFKVVAYKGSQESSATNVYDTRFKITVDTTKAGSASDTFVLPVTAMSTGNYYVNWGDGSAEETFTTTGNKSHTYASSGIYQVSVRGSMTAMAFNNTGDKLKLLYVDNWGNLAWSSCNVMFYGCANMQGRYIDQPNTSAVTSMYGMFYNCTAFNQSVSNFNTSAVKDMTYMFRNCQAFNQSVSNFDTSKVTNMSQMFIDCTSFNQSVSNFNTSAVTNMSFMFSSCTAFNQSVSNFNTSAVTNMSYMFYNCTAFKQSLATFSLTSATNIGNMLAGCNINATGTTTNYDNTLIAWAAADVPNSLSFNGGSSKYSDTGATARASLISDDLWTITDGGHI